MYTLKNPARPNGIKLLTSLDELTSEMLSQITKEVKLKPHYNIILLTYKTSLFNLASTAGGKMSENISITPILAKSASCDCSDCSNCKDCNSDPVKGTILTPIIAPSAIERGHELFIPIAAHINNVMKYINEDNDFRVSLFQKKYTGNLAAINSEGMYLDKMILADNNTNIYCFAFKIVPDTDIVATVPLHQHIDDYSKIVSR